MSISTLRQSYSTEEALLNPDAFDVLCTLPREFRIAFKVALAEAHFVGIEEGEQVIAEHANQAYERPHNDHVSNQALSNLSSILPDEYRADAARAIVKEFLNGTEKGKRTTIKGLSGTERNRILQKLL